MANRLKDERLLRLIRSLFRGVNLESAAYIEDVSPTTALKLFEDLGDTCLQIIHQERDLVLNKIQLDEMWSYVYAKDKRVNRECLNSGKAPILRIGSSYVFLAVEPESRFIPHFYVGARNDVSTRYFVHGLKAKLKTDAHGSPICPPLFLTDGFLPYKKALRLFGNDYRHGVVDKQYDKLGADGQPTNRSKYDGSTAYAAHGKIDASEISTSLIERRNKDLRRWSSRLQRKTDAFSKTHWNHIRAIAIHIIYHNYVHIPRPQSESVDIGDGIKETRRVKRATPAMTLGLSPHKWEAETLLDLTDQLLFRRSLNKASPGSAKIDPDTLMALYGEDERERDRQPANGDGDDSERSFLVYRNKITREAKVHKATCLHAKKAMEKLHKPAKTSEWYELPNLDEARAFAEHLQPDDWSDCSKCIGERRTLGRRL